MPARKSISKSTIEVNGLYSLQLCNLAFKLSRESYFYSIKKFCSVFLPPRFFGIYIAEAFKKIVKYQAKIKKTIFIYLSILYTQNPFITLSSNCRPVRVIKFVSEESIEEGIYTIALEKLRLEQDLTNEEEENNEGEGTFFLSGFESRAF